MRLHPRFERPLSWFLVLAPTLCLSVAAASGRDPRLLPPRVGELELLDAVELTAGLMIDGVPVGGLSSLAYDPLDDRFWALSDDRSELGPARLYRLRVESASPLAAANVVVESSLVLRDEAGRPFPRRSLDPEGLALAPDGGFFVSSEGEAKAGVAPFVAEFDARGFRRRVLALPERFLPDARLTRGVRDNLGLECLGLTPDGRFLMLMTEGALAGDGPSADVGVASWARLRRIDLATQEAQEFLVPLDPVSRPPIPADSFRVNGFSEILPLSRDRFLALEREFSNGAGHRVRIVEVDLSQASEVGSRDGGGAAAIVAARKRLVIDLANLTAARSDGSEPTITNYEGLAFGPPRADGRFGLFVLSDDNFRQFHENAWLLHFAVDPATARIAEVQGKAQRSPRAGRWVAGLEGVITAIDAGKPPRWFVESSRPDSDPDTSEGIQVLADSVPLDSLMPGALPGDHVSLTGRIVERAANEGQLPLTTILVRAVERLGDVELPAAVPLFVARTIPPQLSADPDATFDPVTDPLDFWESLEGMRLTLERGDIAGPTTSFRELVVLPVPSAAPRSNSGATRVDPVSPWLEKVPVSGRLLTEFPDLASGARVGRVEGVLDYGFSSYRLLATKPLEVVAPAWACAGTAESTPLRSSRETLTLATFNLENLSAVSEPQRFERLARDLVTRLASPTIVALEEVQDDDGPGKLGGPTSAGQTLARLIAAVRAAGGPLYDSTSIDPEPDAEGGQPGGNIRVAFLFDPSRVELVRRGTAGPLDATAIEGRGRRTRLTLSPGRVAPRSAAFDLSGTEGVRRSLAAQFRFRGRDLLVVVNHWSSKFADDRAYGARQPPRAPTGEFRLAQAREIRRFAEAWLAADPDAAIVVLGDLNDVEGSPAVAELARPPLVNLSASLAAADRYTFVFEGNAQLLDHVVVSPALARKGAIDIAHFNADCPDSQRNSDHDPSVASFEVRR